MDSRSNDKLAIKFEMQALKQWVKIIVQKSFTIDSLKMLLAKKFDYNFEHITIRAFAPAEKKGSQKER